MKLTFGKILLFLVFAVLLGLAIYFGVTRKSKDCPPVIVYKPPIIKSITEKYKYILEQRYREHVQNYGDVPGVGSLPTVGQYVPMDNITVTVANSSQTVFVSDTNTPFKFIFQPGDQILISVDESSAGAGDGFSDTFTINQYIDQTPNGSTTSVGLIYLSTFQDVSIADMWKGPTLTSQRVGYISIFSIYPFQELLYDQAVDEVSSLDDAQTWVDYLTAWNTGTAPLPLPPLPSVVPPYPSLTPTPPITQTLPSGSSNIPLHRVKTFIKYGQVPYPDLLQPFPTITYTQALTYKSSLATKITDLKSVINNTTLTTPEGKKAQNYRTAIQSRQNNRINKLRPFVKFDERGYSISELQMLAETEGTGNKGKNMLKEALSDEGVNDQLVNWMESIYPGIDGNFTQADWDRFFKQTGMLLLDIALACGECGFLIGPLNSLINEFSFSGVPEPSLQEVIATVVNSALNDQTLSQFVQSQQNLLNSSTVFFTNYNQLKMNGAALCPQPGPCKTDPTNPNQCDPILLNNDGVNCMKNPIAVRPSVLYDPSMILPDPNMSPDQSKRIRLYQFLQDPSSAIQQILFGGTTNGGLQSMRFTNGSGTNIFNVGPGAHISFIDPYQTMLTYLISYYQELSTLDTTVGAYLNPWASTVIGNPNCIINTATGAPAQTIAGQPAGTLLGDLQVYVKEFEQFCSNAASVYFQQININNQGDHCCGTKWNPFNWCPCNDHWAFQIVDNISPTLMDDNWYASMRVKYVNANAYYRNSGQNWTYDNNGVFNALLYFFRIYKEFLNFPNDTVVLMAQAAGLTVNISADQMWDNYICAEFDRRGISYAGSPYIQKIPLVWGFDPQGGYPFSVKRPSYLQAMTKLFNIGGFGNTVPTPAPLPLFGTEIQDSYNFNSFCTPMVSLQPNENFDFKMFNIPGDSNGNWGVGYCSDPNTIGAISCQSALRSAGSFPTPLANSRMAYCVNSNDGVSPITPVPTPATGAGVYKYLYTGSEQSLTVPTSGVSFAYFEIWGAGGSGGGGSINGATQFSFAPGGGGGYIVGKFPVNPGDLISIDVGQGGDNTGKGIPSYGGGGGGTGYAAPNVTLVAGSGGGRTVIYLNDTTEIASAGGGGGGNVAYVNATGTVYRFPGGGDGQGGSLGIVPQSSVSTQCGAPGTSNGGGNGAQTGSIIGNGGYSGTLFKGGSGQSNVANTCGAGGGGGYYGGGAGGTQSGNGGLSGFGGSSGGGGQSDVLPAPYVVAQGTIPILQPANGQISAGHNSPNYPMTITVGDGGTGDGNGNITPGSNGYVVITLSAS